jgi:hypothetical protein
MGLMDRIFGGGEGGKGNVATGVVHNTPAPPPGTQPLAPAPVAGAPAATPAAPQQQQPTEASSPLDAFKLMWDTPKDDKGNPIAPPADPLSSPIFNFDPTKVSEQAKALDFTKGINPELLSGIVENGALNTENLLKLINVVQQNAFAAATLNTGNLVNSALQRNNTNLETALPSRIRSVQLADTPLDNPVLSHPAVAPLVHALRTAQMAKNPNANPADVNKIITDYLSGLTEALQAVSPAATTAREQAASRNTNWDDFFAQ